MYVLLLHHDPTALAGEYLKNVLAAIDGVSGADLLHKGAQFAIDGKTRFYQAAGRMACL